MLEKLSRWPLFFLLDEPAVYGLPPDPVVCTNRIGEIWGVTAVGAGLVVATFPGGGG